ncbi:MAG: T9SS type A sorting domain-containing protein [Bacteroidetes bacterium]|nr:T9SS type A sorting domain-containing protein [Bacteroidota bacterium]
MSASNIGASFGVTSYDGTGDIASGSSISNGDCGIYLTNNASYNVGTNDEFCSNGYDIDAVNGAYAYAINNTYSRTNPVSVGGNVFVTGNIWACSSSSIKQANSSRKGVSVIAQDASPMQDLDARYMALMRRISDDKAANKYASANYTKDYNDLIAGYKSFVTDTGSITILEAALSRISHLYNGMGNNAGFEDYINASLASASFSPVAGSANGTTSVQPYLKRYLIWNYVDGKQYDNAIKTADEVLSSSVAGDDLKAEMLYEEGLIYKYYLADSMKANEMFKSLSNSYPSSPLVRFADVEKTVNPSNSDERNQRSEVEGQQTKDGALENYPNPFNPTTTIKFEVPSSGFVSLQVYDVLGRLVATLVDGNENAGQHSVQFNGQNLASGIYLYRLTAPGIDQVKKMILMK